MALSLEQVRRIADLARLRLSAEEEKTFAVQLSAILDHVRQLEELDVSGVPPMTHALAAGEVPGLREDAEKKRRIAKQAVMDAVESEKKRLKDLHWMRCPKCGMELRTMRFRDVNVDRCFNCHGTWLDEGELETIAGPDQPGLLQKIAAVFRRD